MPSVRTEVEVDFDLEDYEDEIKEKYCYCDCLIDNDDDIINDLKDYLQEMYKNLYIYSESNKRFKTYEEIYDDLSRIIGE